MLTDEEIGELIASRKKITSKSPAKGYQEESGSRRCSLALEGVDAEKRLFSVFIRQNSQFMENYSIGLRHATQNKNFGSVTLVRYNGPHGEKSRAADGHYAKAHIHRLTAEEMESGSLRPQEKYREITDKYAIFEDALAVFFRDTGITNWQDYFPALSQLRLFNG